MRTLWPQLDAWLDEGTPFALATVVATEGSAPRRPGAVMAIDPARTRFLGSVSSGCLETQVLDAARQALAEQTAVTLRFGPDGSSPWVAGLTCGGMVTVRVEPWWGSALAGAVRRWIAEDVAAVVLTWGQRHLGVTLTERVGDAAGWPEAWIASARECLREGGVSQSVDWDGETVFVRCLPPRPRLVLVGAVEVAARLVDLAGVAGWRTVVIDPRQAYLVPERFDRMPEEMHRAWPQAVVRSLALGPADAGLALTHDPKIDDPALVALLDSKVGYVGAMGSRRSHASRLARLREHGVREEDLARIDGPAGYALGAPDAAGIAVGMLAGLVAWVAAREAAPLSHAGA